MIVCAVTGGLEDPSWLEDGGLGSRGGLDVGGLDVGGGELDGVDVLVDCSVSDTRTSCIVWESDHQRRKIEEKDAELVHMRWWWLEGDATVDAHRDVRDLESSIWCRLRCGTDWCYLLNIYLHLLI